MANEEVCNVIITGSGREVSNFRIVIEGTSKKLMLYKMTHCKGLIRLRRRPNIYFRRYRPLGQMTQSGAINSMFLFIIYCCSLQRRNWNLRRERHDAHYAYTQNVTIVTLQTFLEIRRMLWYTSIKPKVFLENLLFINTFDREI